MADAPSAESTEPVSTSVPDTRDVVRKFLIVAILMVVIPIGLLFTTYFGGTRLLLIILSGLTFGGTEGILRISRNTALTAGAVVAVVAVNALLVLYSVRALKEPARGPQVEAAHHE